MGTSVHQARALARRWVAEEGSHLPGFHGAYLAGSINWLPDDAVLPATSDLDINVVIGGPDAAMGREKLLYDGVLLEVTHLPLQWVQTPEQVLGDYHLAGGFRAPSIIADPSGHLTALQTAVSREYARPTWIRRRCEQAQHGVLDRFAEIDPSAPLHDQAMGWLFPTGVTTHVLLVAGLRNPTVRRRYAAVRELLAEHGRLDVHEMLLALLGCSHMTRPEVEERLARVTEMFDTAAAALTSPFPFACDITTIARPLAIDGSREMVEQGFHREAMFWIAVTASRCQAVLAADAPAEVARFEAGYRALLSDLGIASPAAIHERSEQVRTALPHIWDVAEAIMAANPDIQE